MNNHAVQIIWFNQLAGHDAGKITLSEADKTIRGAIVKGDRPDATLEAKVLISQ